MLVQRQETRTFQSDVDGDGVIDHVEQIVTWWEDDGVEAPDGLIDDFEMASVQVTNVVDYRMGGTNPPNRSALVDISALVDPSNNSAATFDDAVIETQDAAVIVAEQNALANRYGMAWSGVWTMQEVQAVALAMEDLEFGMGLGATNDLVGGVEFVMGGSTEPGGPTAEASIRPLAITWFRGNLRAAGDLAPPAFSPSGPGSTALDLGRWVTLHELGHILDYRTLIAVDSANFIELPIAGMLNALVLQNRMPSNGMDMDPSTAVSEYARSARSEDFAETFAALFFGGDWGFMNSGIIAHPRVVPDTVRLDYLRARAIPNAIQLLYEAFDADAARLLETYPEIGLAGFPVSSFAAMHDVGFSVDDIQGAIEIYEADGGNLWLLAADLSTYELQDIAYAARRGPDEDLSALFIAAIRQHAESIASIDRAAADRLEAVANKLEGS